MTEVPRESVTQAASPVTATSYASVTPGRARVRRTWPVSASTSNSSAPAANQRLSPTSCIPRGPGDPVVTVCTTRPVSGSIAWTRVSKG